MKKQISIGQRLKESDKHTAFNGWLVAFMLCINSLAVVTPINGIVVVGSVVCFAALFLTNAKKLLSKVYAKSYMIIVFTIIAFGMNIALNNEDIITEYFFNFLCFGVPFLLLPISDVNLKDIVRNICYLGIFFLPFYVLTIMNYGMLDVSHYDDERLNTMTMSYRLLPYICASIILLIEGEWKSKIVALVVGVPYSIAFFVIGSRGAILSIFLLLFLYFFNGNGISRRKVNRRRIFLIAGLIIITTSFNGIIDWLYSTTQQNDVDILAVNRIWDKLYGTGGDMDSGRSIIIKESFKKIGQSPLIGNGIASSLNYKGYPHNVFVQILEEGGLLIFIPFLLLFLRALMIMLGSKYRTDYFVILVFVFCAGVVQLFFSANYWASQYFWVFVFLVIYNKELQSIRSYRNKIQSL